MTNLFPPQTHTLSVIPSVSPLFNSLQQNTAMIKFMADFNTDSDFYFLSMFYHITFRSPHLALLFPLANKMKQRYNHKCPFQTSVCVSLIMSCWAKQVTWPTLKSKGGKWEEMQNYLAKGRDTERSKQLLPITQYTSLVNFYQLPGTTWNTVLRRIPKFQWVSLISRP